jgi:hypothetical protein
MSTIDDGCPYCGRYCICGRLVEEDDPCYVDPNEDDE